MIKMNRIKYLTLVFVAIFTISGNTGCSDEDTPASVNAGDYKWLALNQSRQVWDGQQNNSVMTLKDDEIGDTVITLNTSLYMNQKADEDCKADIVVNSDSLAKAIGLVDTGGLFARYASAVLMPEDAYAISSKEITLKAGQTKSDDVTVTIHRDKLLSNQMRNNNVIFVLPLSLKNSSVYKINDNVSNLMLFVNMPVQDPTKPDTKNPQTVVDGMKLVWNDEFNEKGKVDDSKWTFENGFQRNHEEQWYQSDNASLDGQGNLLIVGRKETVHNPWYQTGSSDWKKNRETAEYTSASLQSKFTYKYGKVLVRAKIPTASGAWPAIWQVGNTGEWPLGGEIDMLEFYPSNGSPAIHANYCWGSDKRWSGNWQSVIKPLSYFTDKDKDWCSKYHVWCLDWDESTLKISIDGELINEISTSKTYNGNGGGGWDGGQNNPFYNDLKNFGDLIWLNLAIGGDNGGKIDDSAFPMKYYIDYVRVYQK